MRSCFVLLLVLLCLRVCASSLMLAWNPSPGTNIAGYNLYYGSATGNYTNMLSAGLALQLTVSNLAAGPFYYFAVTAYDDLGVESDFSTELSTSIAPILCVSASPLSASISWPAVWPGWTAQASADLVTWTNLPSAVVQGSNFVIIEALTESRRFYRLTR